MGGGCFLFLPVVPGASHNGVPDLVSGSQGSPALTRRDQVTGCASTLTLFNTQASLVPFLELRLCVLIPSC